MDLCNTRNLLQWLHRLNVQHPTWAPSRSDAKCFSKKNKPAWSVFSAHRCRLPNVSANSKNVTLLVRGRRNWSVAYLEEGGSVASEAFEVVTTEALQDGKEEAYKAVVVVLCLSCLRWKMTSRLCVLPVFRDKSGCRLCTSMTEHLRTFLLPCIERL